MQKQTSGSGVTNNLVSASIGNALTSLQSHRTRTVLAMLGIIIGVAAVIGSITLAEGVGTAIRNILLSRGANVIYVQQDFGNSSTVRSDPLTVQDLQALQKLPYVTGASPVLNVGGQAIYGNHNWRTNFIGVNTTFQTIHNWKVVQGSWFSTSDERGGQPAVVIGNTVKENLFGSGDALGKKITLLGTVCMVKGILETRGGEREDDVVYLPYTTLQTRLFKAVLNEFDISVDASNHLDQTVQAITRTLEIRHHFQNSSQDNFSIETSLQQAQDTQRETDSVAMLLSSVAAISLTIGGIGIMNIMLVSVVERTREIGIRLAIGARRRDIRWQFLFEALGLTFSGGLLGMLLGVVVGWLMVGVVLQAIVGQASGGSPLVISPLTLLLPFAISTVIGLVFGLYPAIRAARLDPVVALRRAK
jgi:putative ABC transport system permease protein